jgi:hypothetical protein
MSMNVTHDPDAHLDYKWDWTPWLGAGETISDHTISVLPPGELVLDNETATSNSVTVWIAGGWPGRTYHVTCHIVTNQTRADDRKFILSVKDR